jgi:hypothetical protein
LTGHEAIFNRAQKKLLTVRNFSWAIVLMSLRNLRHSTSGVSACQILVVAPSVFAHYGLGRLIWDGILGFVTFYQFCKSRSFDVCYPVWACNTQISHIDLGGF